MAKGKTSVFFCQNCGYESSKWMGQCPACKEWNTFAEEPVQVSSKSARTVSRSENTVKPQQLSQIRIDESARTSTGMKELDRVLGGGIVAGSLVLVGGDPGIGKSTLLLQVCQNLTSGQEKVLYVSGEESLQQIKLRANRMGDFSDSLLILCETNLENIREVIQRVQPSVVIIDSIQTMYNENVTSAPGSVSQVRESTGVLLQIAKGMGVTIFIVGHVTKEGVVAGPRVLEHMVDTVLYFEGDRHASYRILRGVKNRFGSTNEIGVFEMIDTGLKEIPNPSEVLLSGRPVGVPGTCVACVMEGTRPVLAEVQALVTKTSFNVPRRTTNGFDFNRAALLMAVLEKRGGLKLGMFDAYVNVIGGLHLDEPAADLPVILAIASSYRDQPIQDNLAAIGEVGLAGELRAVNHMNQRLSELHRLGFERCIIPRQGTDKLVCPPGMQLLRQLAQIQL